MVRRVQEKGGQRRRGEEVQLELETEWARQLTALDAVSQQAAKSSTRLSGVLMAAECVAASRLGFGIQIPNHWLHGAPCSKCKHLLCQATFFF